MQRRDALKNIGLSLGAITMSSSIASLIQSCSKGATWTPEFFSEEEAEIVAKALEIMLPGASDIPGANQLNLCQFLDGHFNIVSFQDEKDWFKKGIGTYLSSTVAISGKRNAAALTADDIESRLAHYLKATAAQQNTWDAAINDEETKEGSMLSEDASNFHILKSLRGKGMWAYKISEAIGENVLAYAPIPSQQKGCVDLQETTGGKAWAL